MSRNALFAVGLLSLPNCSQVADTGSTHDFLVDGREIVSNFDGNGEGNLWLSEVCSVEPTTVLIGGAIHMTTATGCAVLLVSHDEGQTWREVIRAHYASQVEAMCSWGTHAWVLVAFTGEGTCSPEYLYRTVDSGMNWERISLDHPHWGTSGMISPQVELRFADSLNGYAILRYDMWEGGDQLLITKDGGVTWEIVLEGRPSDRAEAKFDMAMRWSPDHPADALWGYRAGIVRVREDYDADRILVETRRFDSEDPWVLAKSFPSVIDMTAVSEAFR